MKRLVSLASFLMVLLSFSSFAEAASYQAHYGDLDGVFDIHIAPMYFHELIFLKCKAHCRDFSLVTAKACD